MRSPRGCRSLCSFKVRAPNRFNWHLRPWTQHKSLRRTENGVGEESGSAITVSFVFATLCWGNFSSLNGSELTTIAMWARGAGRGLTNSDGRAWKTSWTPHATVEYSQRKKNPMGVCGQQFKLSFVCRAQHNLTLLKMGMGMFCDLPLQSYIQFNLNFKGNNIQNIHIAHI